MANVFHEVIVLASTHNLRSNCLSRQVHLQYSNINKMLPLYIDVVYEGYEMAYLIKCYTKYPAAFNYKHLCSKSKSQQSKLSLTSQQSK